MDCVSAETARYIMDGLTYWDKVERARLVIQTFSYECLNDMSKLTGVKVVTICAFRDGRTKEPLGTTMEAMLIYLAPGHRLTIVPEQQVA